MIFKVDANTTNFGRSQNFPLTFYQLAKTGDNQVFNEQIIFTNKIISRWKFVLLYLNYRIKRG